jgi:hypothetical protein
MKKRKYMHFNRRMLVQLELLTTLACCCIAQTTTGMQATKPKRFDHVVIVVLENQSFDSAMKSDVLKGIAAKGVLFTNFENLYHPSYPNYLAMIAGSDFDTHKRGTLKGDNQVDLPDDSTHRTIGDLLNWRNYAEDYPKSPEPFLGHAKGKYARKHVPFLSFKKIQSSAFQNVVSVDTHSTDNAFVRDISAFVKDGQKHPLPEYIFYSPNLDDDGHDPVIRPSVGLRKASTWLSTFLTTWLNFDETTWLPKDEQLNRTLFIITFDESEGKNRPERLYTVFLGNMVKPQQVGDPYNHYSVLHTIEDNFGLRPLYASTGDGTAVVIQGIWK